MQAWQTRPNWTGRRAAALPLQHGEPSTHARLTARGVAQVRVLEQKLAGARRGQDIHQQWQRKKSVDLPALERSLEEARQEHDKVRTALAQQTRELDAMKGTHRDVQAAA